MASRNSVGKNGLPANELLQGLSPRDFALISPYLDLQAKACLCDTVSRRHFDEVMDGLYPTKDG
jgi:hypothetical protein